MSYSQYKLDETEKKILLTVGECVLSIRTQADFEAWISGPVKAYFPHQVMIGVVAQVIGEDIRVRHLIGVSCPAGFLKSMNRTHTFAERSIVQRWLSEYKAQIFNAEDFSVKLSLQDQENMRLLGVHNLAAFGCLDADGLGGTHFGFYGLPGQLTERHAYKLELLMPHLHQAILRVVHLSGEQLRAAQQPLSAQLTRRERQILALIATGLSNRAIAEKLSRSELTVQNHVHAIFKKLGVRNRAAAAAFCREYLATEITAIAWEPGVPDFTAS